VNGGIMKIISIKEAARILSSSPQSIRKWVKAGAFPLPIRTPGGDWKFEEEDIEKWVESRKSISK
jgi:excisionase family DNA binding protein